VEVLRLLQSLRESGSVGQGSAACAAAGAKEADHWLTLCSCLAMWKCLRWAGSPPCACATPFQVVLGRVLSGLCEAAHGRQQVLREAATVQVCPGARQPCTLPGRPRIGGTQPPHLFAPGAGPVSSNKAGLRLVGTRKLGTVRLAAVYLGVFPPAEEEQEECLIVPYELALPSGDNTGQAPRLMR